MLSFFWLFKSIKTLSKILSIIKISEKILNDLHNIFST
jgi:hypothetical protein